MVTQGKTRRSITLTFAHDIDGPVYVAGTFNGWDTHSTPMRRSKGGQWQTQLRLPPGEYQFRYFANGQWFTDYAAGGVVPNGLGEFNSLLVVPDSDASSASPGKLQPVRAGSRA